MTNREFWVKFYRHLKGMADAVKELIEEGEGVWDTIDMTESEEEYEERHKLD